MNLRAATLFSASLLAAEEAQAQGFTQVLWLDGIAQRYIDAWNQTDAARPRGGNF